MSASAFTPAPTASSQAEIDRLFNLSLDLLCVAGLDGYFKVVNPSWTRVLGWSRDELLARPVSDFMHPDDRARTLAARARLAEGIPVRGLENRYLCKDGSFRWLSWQSAIEPGAATVFAVARDITEQKEREAEHLLRDKLESTGILAGGIAHDFNNLLASLALSLEMAGLIGPVTPEQKSLLQHARTTVSAAQALTGQLLAFARVGGPERKPVDPAPLLRASLHHALAGSAVRGQCELPDDLWPVLIDESQIDQVLRNLLNNARDAMTHGGTIRLRAENITPESAMGERLPAGRHVCVHIEDEGDGIAASDFPHIFEPYFSTKPRGPQKGMGLGLAICHAVIRHHGGVLTVQSTPGRGTTVRCVLPVA